MGVIDDKLRRAVDLLNDGQPQAAVPVIGECLRLAGHHVEVRRIAAITARRLGDLAAARRQMRTAIALDPAAAALYAELAQFSQTALDLADAELCAARAARLDPQSIPAQAQLGVIRLARKRGAAAVEGLRRVVCRHPGTAEALYQLGYMLQATQRQDEAAVSFRRAVRVDPGHALALRGLAQAMFELDRMPESRALLERLKPLDPVNAEPLDLALRDHAAAVADRAHCGTVVIPAFRAEADILRALDSIERSVKYFRHRTRRPDALFRIVVVDDRSPDGTAAAVRRWGEERQDLDVLAVSCGRNRGQGYARNLGARLAAGPYLWFLDADDLFLPPHLYVGHALMERHPDVAVVKTGFVLDVEVHPTWYNNITFTCPSNCCVRLQCHELIGGFNEEDCSRGLEDGSYMEFLSTLFTAGFVDDRTVWHTHHPGNNFDKQLKLFELPPEQRHLVKSVIEPRYVAEKLLAQRRFRLLEGLRGIDWNGPPIHRDGGSHMVALKP